MKRIKAVYCSLSGSVCGCNHPKSDKQSYFNWCDICCNSLEAKVDEPAEVQQIYTENRKYKFIFNSVDPLKKFIFSLPSCNSTCLKIKNLDIKKDKNNNNMYINLTNPRHCQDCRHLIKEFIPYSSQYFIDNISAELEIFKKTISVEKKVEVLVKKIEKDEFNKEVQAMVEARNSVKRKEIEDSFKEAAGLPSSTSKSKTPKPVTKVVVLEPEAKAIQAEMERDFKFYKDFFDFYSHTLKDYSHRSRRLAATEIYQRWDDYSTNKKCLMAGIGAARMKEKPEYSMKPKEVEFFQYVANECKESPEIDDFIYTNDHQKAFFAETAGFKALDNTTKTDDEGNEVNKKFRYRYKFRRRSMPTTKTILIEKYNMYLEETFNDTGGPGTKRIGPEKATEIWPFFCVPAGPRDYATSVCPTCYNLDSIRHYVQARRDIDKLPDENLYTEATKINADDKETFRINKLVYVEDGTDKKGKPIKKWQNRITSFKPSEFSGIVKAKLSDSADHRKILKHEKSNWYPILNHYLESGWLFMNSDFAMNPKAWPKNSPQEDFMKPTERQMVCNVLKFQDKAGDIKKIYATHLGDDKRHDNVLVSQAIVDMYRELEEKFGVKFPGLFMKSDNMGPQYKCRYALGNYYTVAKKLDIPQVLVCYGTALHGKCECDALGGGMKGILKRVGLAGGEVYTAAEMAKVLSEHPSPHVDKWIHAQWFKI